MRILLANLKHFYQCRVLWFIYLWVLLFLGTLFCFYLQTCWGPHDIGRSKGMYFTQMGFVCAFSFAVGLILASLQTDVMTKPFSFCLPGHRILCRRLMFLVGLITNLITLLGWPWDSVPLGLSPLHLLGVGLTAYFVGLIMGMTFTNMALGVAMIAILFLPMGGSLLDSRIPKEHALVIASPAVICALAIAGRVWLWLGKADLFRRRCGRPWLSLPGWWNPAAREKYRWARLSAKASRTPPPRAERFLFGTMKGCGHWSLAKYVWGALYAWLLPGGGGRSRIVSAGLLSLASGVVAWYFPQMGPFFVANVSVYGGDVLRNPPANSHLLLAGGRRERFFATMALIIVLGAIVTGGLMLGSIAADLLGIRSPMSEPYREYQESYIHAVVTQAMNLRLVVLFAALFPVSRWLEIRFLGRRVLARGTQLILLLSVASFGQFTLPLLATIPPVDVVFVFILSWVVGVYGMHRTIMRSDLGRR